MPLPLYPKDPINAPASSQIKITLAIAAGKGGVGKSTVTVGLALALQEQGYAVGILDSDLYGPSVRKMLPEERLPSQQGDLLLPALCFGMPVISMAYFRREQEAAAVRAPIANSILSQFIAKVAWGNLDILLIDFPPGTGDIQLTLSQKAHLTAAIMVTTPQEVALLDVRRALTLFSHMRVPILGIVENMSYYEPVPGAARLYPMGKGGGARLAHEIHVPLLASIPLDPIVSDRGDRGVSILVDDGSGSPQAAESFRSLARQVIQCLPALPKLSAFTLPWHEYPSPPVLPSIHNPVGITTTGSSLASVVLHTLQQRDNHHFDIMWTDGMTHRYQLGELQKHCPCAACSEVPPQVDPHVRALYIQNVGNYALQIAFTSGCSHGLYGYDMLYHLGSRLPFRHSIRKVT
jgi:ATP-binding protein involved in chromosome partitioning